MVTFDWRKQLTGCLTSTQFFSLSTLLDGKSWTHALYFAFDDAFNLYFISMPKSQHMKNIEKNQNVSAAIYTTNQDPLGDVVGIQLLGKARILKRDDTGEIESAFKIYYKRVFPKTFGVLSTIFAASKKTPKDFLGKKAEWNFVKFTPTEMYYFDTRYFGEERQRVPREVFEK